MTKRSWWIVRLVAFSLIIIFGLPVFAVDTAAKSGFDVWKAQKTIDVTKVWTITFSAPLSKQSVNNNTIYVTDSKLVKVGTKVALSEDGLSVTVSPTKAYEDGDYSLYILDEVTSEWGVQLEQTIVVPFTVVKPSLKSYVELKVTIVDDLKKPYGSDVAGGVTLKSTNNSGGGKVSKEEEEKKGKHTFWLFKDDEYFLNYIGLDDRGRMFTQTMSLGKIKMPAPKKDSTETKTTKSANFIISSKDGVEAGKSGAIGGRTTYPGETSVGYNLPRAGVNVEVYNNKTTWTTTTDVNGEYRIYLPTGTYTLVVHGNGSQYKKHTFKNMKVTAGSMATPAETVNVEVPIGNLGLKLNVPAVDSGAGVLSGIDAATTSISGKVNKDAVVEIYDVSSEEAQAKAIVTAKPNASGEFTAKLSNLAGKRLEIRVTDGAGNLYKTTMLNVIS